MKKLLAVLTVVGLCLPVFAQFKLPEYKFASGSWELRGDRLYQTNEKAPLAKVNIKLPQSGTMTYSFNAHYESGAMDGHGGFGLHLFADSVYPAASWGCGKSYLMWLNYDLNPKNPKIPKGLSAQIYRSLGNSYMQLVKSVDLNHLAPLLTAENLAKDIPVKITMDGNSGEVRFYDPLDQSQYLYYQIDKADLPMKGAWMAIRTNGMAMSFSLAD